VGVGLAVRFNNYLWLPAAVVIITLGEVLTLKWRFWRSFPHYRAEATREAFAIIRRRAKYVLFHRVGGLIYYQSDFIILSLVASLALVKDYAQVQYAVAGVLGLSSAVFNALTASIARRQLGVSTDARWRQYATVLRSTYFLAVCIGVAFVACAPPVVEAVFHGGALSSQTYLLFAILLFLNMIKQVDDTFITATGTFHVAFYLPIVESSTYALLGILLAKRYGIDGIVSAGIATNLLFAVIGKSLVVASGIFGGAKLRMMMTKLATAGIAMLLALPVIALFAWPPLQRQLFLRIAVSCAIAGTYALAIAWALVRRGYAHASTAVNAEEVPSWTRGAA
jgi:O-antigen/teichoic acid export membrane protein